MFHFASLPSYTYVFSAWCYDITRNGFPHSEIPDYNAYLSAYRGLSQITTSFFGFLYQGIHHMLLVALF